MVALVTSLIITVGMAQAIFFYAARRPEGTPYTWGEAMAGAVYVFFLVFLIFGVVPHQWLTLAENEWSFRADRIFTAGGLVTPISQGGWFPFDITFRVLSDSIAAVIYILGLAGMMYQWKYWQERSKRGTGMRFWAKALPAGDVSTSTYGRPLVKRG